MMPSSSPSVGTNDNGDSNSSENSGNDIHPDKDHTDGMRHHYKLLQTVLTGFLDQYVSDNSISKVYVTGHSFGGTITIQIIWELIRR